MPWLGKNLTGGAGNSSGSSLSGLTAGGVVVATGAGTVGTDPGLTITGTGGGLELNVGGATGINASGIYNAVGAVGMYAGMFRLGLGASVGFNSGSWSATPDLGLARSSPGVLNVTDGSTGYGSIRIGGGAWSAAALGMGAADTGFLSPSAGKIGSIYGGVIGPFFASNLIAMRSDGAFKWASGTDATIGYDLGLARSSPGVLKVTDGGAGRGVLLVDNGTDASPGIGFTTSGTGIQAAGSGLLFMGGGIRNGTIGSVSTGYFNVPAAGGYAWASNADPYGIGDLWTTRAAPATLQLGAADAASPVNQTLKAQGATGTDHSGANLTIQSGPGTGSAVGSSIVFQTPAAHGSDSVQQTPTTRMTIAEAGIVLSGLPVYADNTAAAALATGTVYRTSTGTLMVKY